MVWANYDCWSIFFLIVICLESLTFHFYNMMYTVRIILLKVSCTRKSVHFLCFYSDVFDFRVYFSYVHFPCYYKLCMDNTRFKLVFPLSLLSQLLYLALRQNNIFRFKRSKEVAISNIEAKVIVVKFNHSFLWLKCNLLIPGKCTATRPIFLTVYDYPISG